MPRSPRSTLLVLVLSSMSARAEDPAKKNSCIHEHAESQKLKKTGKLSQARELLVSCASEDCPAPIRAECGQWAQEVEASMPSILIEVRGDDGALKSDVEVWIDGERRATSLSGMSLPVDPGERDVEVRPAGERPLRRRVLVNVGAKGQSVVFALPRKKAALAPVRKTQGPSDSKGPPTTTWVLGSLGVVALGVGGYFGYTAKTRADELEDCRPRCDRDEADAMRQKALVADISLGVGLVALGVATYLWVSDAPKDRGPSRSQRLRGREMPNSSMRWMSVRREMPSSFAARVWLPAL